MAVHARDVRGGGEGQVVDVALYEAVFNLMESMVPEVRRGRDRARAYRQLAPRHHPSNTYCSGDGSFVAIGGNSDAIFKRLMEAIGRAELGDDPRYATNADRTEHADELDALIEGWVEGRPTEEIIGVLDAANVPVGPIYTVEDIVEDEQYEAREMLPEAEVEGVGPVKMPGLVPKLSATPGPSSGTAALWGPTTRRFTAASRPLRRGDPDPLRGWDDLVKQPEFVEAGPRDGSTSSRSTRPGEGHMSHTLIVLQTAICDVPTVLLILIVHVDPVIALVKARSIWASRWAPV